MAMAGDHCHASTPLSTEVSAMTNPTPRFSLRLVALLFAAATMAACQPTVYLMPTPKALASGQHDPFAVNPDLERSSRVTVAYATNRLPFGTRNSRVYMTIFDQGLRLGAAEITIGDGEMSWEQLHQLSTTAERAEKIPLKLRNALEMATVDSTTTDGALTAEAKSFFEELNLAIDKAIDKDLTIYVHGANSDFYRANAQAAQLRHFTGRNSVVMTFAWPSAESLLSYAVDVYNSEQTAPTFARLLELLARHSNARQIDIIAYSAGAQVASPALRLLHEKYAAGDALAAREALRIGEVYFAAPDIDFEKLVTDLPGHIELASHITVAVNPNDTVLSLAADHHGVSRAGRPDPDELSVEETQLVIDASRNLEVDFLWIDAGHIPDMSRGAHDFWYNHPWVSTDVLVQILFNARPAERGLEPHKGEAGGTVWSFPPDYPERVSDAIGRLKAIPGN
jgi:esterase/lipase superfamily enzyme